MSFFETRIITQARRATVRRTLESELLALAPPYRTFTRVRSIEEGERLPLGTVVVGVGETTLAVLAALTQLTYSCPWAVPCLIIPATQEPLAPLLMLVTELRDRLAVVSGGERLRSDQGMRNVVRCVASRPLPTPSSLASWLTQRLGHLELQAPLRSQFAMALGRGGSPEDRSVATYSRLFSRYGPYTAHDWRAIARLSRQAQAGTLQRENRRGMGLPVRTASRYARQYLELPHHAFGERLGWEWVLEAALRTARYV